jgi:hypothetical protein
MLGLDLFESILWPLNCECNQLVAIYYFCYCNCVSVDARVRYQFVSKRMKCLGINYLQSIFSVWVHLFITNRKVIMIFYHSFIIIRFGQDFCLLEGIELIESLWNFYLIELLFTRRSSLIIIYPLGIHPILRSVYAYIHWFVLWLKRPACFSVAVTLCFYRN